MELHEKAFSSQHVIVVSMLALAAFLCKQIMVLVTLS